MDWIMLFCFGMHLGQIYVYVCGILCHQLAMTMASERDAAKMSQDALATLLTLLPPLGRTLTEHPPSPVP
jgi:hypothetical protein